MELEASRQESAGLRTHSQALSAQNEELRAHVEEMRDLVLRTGALDHPAAYPTSLGAVPTA